MKQFWHWALVIGVIFFAIRLMGFGLEMAEDEQIWAIPTVAPNGFQFQLIPHPPLAVFVYSLMGLFGSWRLLRFVPMLFSIGVFLLAMLYARRKYGDQAALFAGGILALSVWSVLASVQLDMDGAIIAFFGLAATYTFSRWVDEGKFIWLLGAGIVSGLGLLSKITFVLFLGSFALYSVWLALVEKRSVRSFVPSVMIYIIAVGMLGVVLALSSLFGWQFLSQTGAHASYYFSGLLSQDWLNVASILAQAVALASPLLIGLAVLAALKAERKDALAFIIIGVHIFFFLFVTTASFRPFERYWMPIIPLLAILGGKAIASWKLSSSELKRVARASFAGALLVGTVTLLVKPALLPLYPKDIYLGRLFSFEWNFLFPFHGASGPLAFFVPFWLVVFAFLAAVVCIAIALSKQARAALLIFLVIGIAYNVYASEELLLSLTTPNLNSVSREVVATALASPLHEPVILYQGTGHFEMVHRSIKFDRIWASEFSDESIAEKINGRTVLVVDFPSATRDSAMWRALSACAVQKSFIEKDYELGLVLSC